MYGGDDGAGGEARATLLNYRLLGYWVTYTNYIYNNQSFRSVLQVTRGNPEKNLGYLGKKNYRRVRFRRTSSLQTLFQSRREKSKKVRQGEGCPSLYCFERYAVTKGTYPAALGGRPITARRVVTFRAGEKLKLRADCYRKE